MNENPPTLVSVTALLPLASTPPDATAVHPGVAALLAERLRHDPARPAVTYYDDATGERVELSTATLDNWVAKTANLLVDTLGLVPGDKVAVDLPAHWSTAAILLAAWSAGAEVLLAATADGAPGAATSGVKVAFVAADRVEEALAEDADEVVALSLRPLGGRLAHPIAGMLDYAAEVPGHGDRFRAPAPPAEQEALLRFAAHVARAWGLGPSDRVLSAAGMGTADGLVAGLLGPLAVGASVVLCRHLDTALLPRRVEVERVTAVCGVAGALPAGIRRLAVPTGHGRGGEPSAPSWARTSVNPPGLDVVDEAADRPGVRQEGTRPQHVDRGPDVSLDVGERMDSESRAHAGPVFELAPEPLVRDGLHAAPRVVDKNDLRGAEFVLAHRQGTDHVVGHDATGVAHDMCITFSQPEQGMHVEAGIHAGDDSHSGRGCGGERPPAPAPSGEVGGTPSSISVAPEWS
jgi:uncharacterized protein (TIGR03089 family)